MAYPSQTVLGDQEHELKLLAGLASLGVSPRLGARHLLRISLTSGWVQISSSHTHTHQDTAEPTHPSLLYLSYLLACLFKDSPILNYSWLGLPHVNWGGVPFILP